MRNGDGIFGGSYRLNLYLSLVVAALVASLVYPASAQAQIDSSVNDSFNSDVTIDAQSQECAAIIEQFNNAVAGDAVAANEAVARTAAVVNAPVNVVRGCLQASGDVVIGSADNDGNNDGNDDANDDGNDDANVTEDVSGGQEETEDGAVQNDSTSAAQEQYDRTSTGQEDSCAVALDPRVTVAENGEGSENLNVESGQEGDYRISYDLGDQTREINVRITSAETGSTQPINFTATDDGSRTVTLSATSYEITVTPTPDEGGYTVEVSRCGASSDDPDNTMNNTYDNGKQLANTGGPTASFATPSAALIPLGAAFVIAGLIAAAYLRHASDRS